MTDKILDHFSCPICLEIPESEVFQCFNGHTFCAQCMVYLKICPQCRAHLGSEKIRNRTLEQLLDLMEFPCPNSKVGCGKQLRRNEIMGHLKYCKFEPFYFCKIIGFQDCEYNASSRNLANGEDNQLDILNHLLEAHPEIKSYSLDHTETPELPQKILLTCQNLLSRVNTMEKGSISVWSPFLVHFDTVSSKRNRKDEYSEKEKISLLFLCQLSQVTKNATWVGLKLSSGICDFERIQYKIRVGSNRNPGNYSSGDGDASAPEMKWRAPVLDFHDIDKDLESYSLGVPFCVLNSLDSSQSKNNVNQNVSVEIKLLPNSKASSPGRTTSKEDEIKISTKEMTSFKPKASSLVLQRIQEERRDTCNLNHDHCFEHREQDENSRNSYRENNSSPLPPRTGGGIVFPDVYCNACGRRPMIDIRYKCLQCLDFDLCKDCMENRQLHSHHVFARIQDMSQNELFNLKQRVWSYKGKSSYI